MTSGLDLPLLCRLSYEVGQRKSGTIEVVNRGEEKVRVHMNVVPRSTMNIHILSIFVHISGSIRPITLIWASLEISSPPAEVEHR